ncbi:hypothetical protein Tco_1278027 [Tanacetum coccineum]
MDTGGRKNNHKKKEDSVLGSGLATVDEIMNDAIPLVNGAAAKEDGGNGIDVVVPVESICAISDRFANTTYGFFLGKKVAYPVFANYVRNTWEKYGFARSMFNSSTSLFSFQFSSMEGLDVMLENGPCVPVTAFNKDGLSFIATKLGASEEKTLKKPCQSSRGVLVGPKIGFKPHKKYRPVPKKPNASYSGTNGGLQIWKFEDLLSSGQAILVDNAGNPLKKVKLMDEYDSEDEIESVDNDMARSLASEKGRMKHTEDTSPFPSGQCPKGNISIEKVVSEDNIADILSLPLKCESFNYFRLSLGMMEHIP